MVTNIKHLFVNRYQTIIVCKTLFKKNVVLQSSFFKSSNNTFKKLRCVFTSKPNIYCK